MRDSIQLDQYILQPLVKGSNSQISILTLDPDSPPFKNTTMPSQFEQTTLFDDSIDDLKNEIDFFSIDSTENYHHSIHSINNTQNQQHNKKIILPNNNGNNYINSTPKSTYLSSISPFNPNNIQGQQQQQQQYLHLTKNNSKNNNNNNSKGLYQQQQQQSQNNMNGNVMNNSMNSYSTKSTCNNQNNNNFFLNSSSSSSLIQYNNNNNKNNNNNNVNSSMNLSQKNSNNLFFLPPPPLPNSGLPISKNSECLQQTGLYELNPYNNFQNINNLTKYASSYPIHNQIPQFQKSNSAAFPSYQQTSKSQLYQQSFIQQQQQYLQQQKEQQLQQKQIMQQNVEKNSLQQFNHDYPQSDSFSSLPSNQISQSQIIMDTDLNKQLDYYPIPQIIHGSNNTKQSSRNNICPQEDYGINCDNSYDMNEQIFETQEITHKNNNIFNQFENQNEQQNFDQKQHSLQQQQKIQLNSSGGNIQKQQLISNSQKIQQQQQQKQQQLVINEQSQFNHQISKQNPTNNIEINQTNNINHFINNNQINNNVIDKNYNQNQSSNSFSTIISNSEHYQFFSPFFQPSNPNILQFIDDDSNKQLILPSLQLQDSIQIPFESNSLFQFNPSNPITCTNQIKQQSIPIQSTSNTTNNPSKKQKNKNKKSSKQKQNQKQQQQQKQLENQQQQQQQLIQQQQEQQQQLEQNKNEQNNEIEQLKKQIIHNKDISESKKTIEKNSTGIGYKQYEPTSPIPHHRQQQQCQLQQSQLQLNQQNTQTYKPQQQQQQHQQQQLIIKQIIHHDQSNHDKNCYNLYNEYTLQSNIDHDYILKPIQLQLIQQSKDHPHILGGCYIIYPKAESDMYDYCLTPMNKSINIEEIRLMMKQISSALYYIHDIKNIVHCDIKPENIFKLSHQHFVLADFGLAHYILDQNSIKDCVNNNQNNNVEILNQKDKNNNCFNLINNDSNSSSSSSQQSSNLSSSSNLGSIINSNDTIITKRIESCFHCYPQNLPEYVFANINNNMHQKQQFQEQNNSNNNNNNNNSNKIMINYNEKDDQNATQDYEGNSDCSDEEDQDNINHHFHHQLSNHKQIENHKHHQNHTQSINLSTMNLCEEFSFKTRQSDYFPPEIISYQQQLSHNNNYNNELIDEKKSDVFALGMTLFVCLFKNYPYQEICSIEDQLYKYLCSNDKKSKDQFWSRFVPALEHYANSFDDSRVHELVDLIEKMLHPNHHIRLSMKQVIEHPWLNNNQL